MMLTKILALSILSTGLWMTMYNNSIFTAAKIQPYHGNFDVFMSAYFSDAETLDAIDYAGQARMLHGTNLTKVAEHMRGKLYSRCIGDWHCYASFGEIRGSFRPRRAYIYLRSDTADEMHIFCLQTLGYGNILLI